jgi:hypothetical protein
MLFKNRPSLTVRSDLVSNEPFCRESVERVIHSEGAAVIDYFTDDDGSDETDCIGFADSWVEARELVRRYFERAYMQGDCWHLAIAMNAMLGLPLGGVGRMDGDDWIIDHVFAYLPDGNYLDIRGVHTAFDGLISYRPEKGRVGYSDRPVTVDDIVRELDGFARDEGHEPFSWLDPQQYEFASLSRQLVTVLEFDRFIPAPTLSIR